MKSVTPKDLITDIHKYTFDVCHLCRIRHQQPQISIIMCYYYSVYVILQCICNFAVDDSYFKGVMLYTALISVHLCLRPHATASVDYQSLYHLRHLAGDQYSIYSVVYWTTSRLSIRSAAVLH